MSYEAYGRVVLANLTNTSAATQYYPSASGLALTGKTVLALHYHLQDTTVTLEASNVRPEDTTEDGITATWVDVTKFATDLNDNSTGNTNVAATAGAVFESILQFNGICAERFRVKSVTANATNIVRFILRTM